VHSSAAGCLTRSFALSAKSVYIRIDAFFAGATPTGDAMNFGLALLFAAGIGAHAAATAADVPPAIMHDPPADKTVPASGHAEQIPSHGDAMNAMVYLPAGQGPHPVVVLLHGFPGNEQNLDLAQAVRRAGWAVVTFHYRGSWGSAGTFTFDGAAADGAAALA